MVADLADPPKIRAFTEAVRSTWSASELQQFLDHVREDRLFAAWRLSALTGMRRGEVLGLRWSDIDFDTKRLSIRQSLISVDYAVSFSESKTSRGRRSVALDVDTAMALRDHRRRQVEERLLLGAGYEDEGLVFATLDGQPVHPNSFTQRFNALVRAAELPRIRLHDLRHTHATLALQAGVHPKVVSERLGHTTVAFTMDVYSHSIPAMQAEAADVVAALVAGA